MAGTKEKPKKEIGIIEGYRNVSITNLRDVLQRERGNRYEAEYPIFDSDGHRLLLDKGKTISDERFRQLELANWRNIKMHKQPRYYFQRKSSDISFN